MKRCPTCSTEKPLTEFYAARRSRDGLKSQCKACHTAGSLRTRNEDLKRAANAKHMRRSRATNLEKHRARDRARHRPVDSHVKARRAVHAALRAGKITKPATCCSCGSAGRVTAHHPDYSKPLAVEWLCYLCHGKAHRRVTP